MKRLSTTISVTTADRPAPIRPAAFRAELNPLRTARGFVLGGLISGLMWALILTLSRYLF